MAKNEVKMGWQDKVVNVHQVGGIETSVLDNGLGRGNRIAWVNTGSGLRYKVVIDRGLDIVDAFYNQHSLGWLTHAGVTAPRPDANRGIEWLYSFGAGLLTTCGLTHFGPPESDESGERGLHGRYSNIPAEVESVVQPKLTAGSEMSITGTVKETRLFGSLLELRRTISSKLGESVIKIQDVVTNAGNTESPLMLLYHCNFGWPMVDDGSELLWKGKYTLRGGPLDGEMFNDKRNYRKCMPSIESHRGAGEALAFVDIEADKDGFCRAGLVNRKLVAAVAMTFQKKQLPWLNNWQHWGFGEYVTGIEPGTNPPMGQGKAKQAGQLMYIKPGESKNFELELKILTDTKEIDNFVKLATGQ